MAPRNRYTPVRPRAAFRPGVALGPQIMQAAQDDILGQIQTAVLTTGSVESEMLQTLGALLGNEGFLRQNAPAFREGFTDVGLAAQRAMVAAYTHRRPRRPKNVYRTDDSGRNERFAGGRLLAALRNEGNVIATERGVRFIDTSILDQEAKQWRRLNFGAGGKAGRAPAQFPVEWGGLIVASLGLPPDPRPAFRIPRGYWVASGARVGAGQGTGDAFFPVGSTASDAPRGRRGRPSPARMTAGIAATNFLDAGVRAIANFTPPVIIGVYREAANTRMAAVASQAKALGVSVADPGATQYFFTFRRDKLVGGGFARTYSAF